MSKTWIDVSNICKAFYSKCVGSKVIHRAFFFEELASALGSYRMPDNGQGFISLPQALPYVSLGVTRRAELTQGDFVFREWRGQWDWFASRRSAVPTQLNVVVYTKEAYLKDSDIDQSEFLRIEEADPIHVIVAVLASADEPSPQPSHRRFVENLAGGNARYDFQVEHMSKSGMQSALQVVLDDAKAVSEYNRIWITVAD